MSSSSTLSTLRQKSEQGLETLERHLSWLSLEGKGFAVFTIIWFAKARLLACIYAVIITVVVFNLPLYSHADGFFDASVKSIESLGWMLTHSVYFYAVYASIITVMLVSRLPKTAAVLAKGVDLVEYLGRIIVPIIPFMLQLLLLIPIVFLIAYGIPGIPGELVIFGDPIALSLGLAPEVTPVFLALYIGLQIGLPDSFRTAANSTDECLSAIILNNKYRA